MAHEMSMATAEEVRPSLAEHRALLRGIAAVGLLGIALIHLLDLPGKLEETPYLGVAFILLIIASLLLAAMLARRDDQMAWRATAALAAAVILGYVVNRTVGLPGAMDDLGNWLEPLGLASLFVEGTVVATAVSAIRFA
jgi:hypothetical protein